MTPQRTSFLRRKLLTANAVMSELNESRTIMSQKKRTILHRLISGRIVKKYRCVSAVSRWTGSSRRSLRGANTKDTDVKLKRQCLTRKVMETVVQFLQRDDNAKLQPGKRDCKKNETIVARKK